MLIIIILLFSAFSYFTAIVYFSPFEIPDVFSSFNPLLWLSILGLGILLTVLSLRNQISEVFSSLLLWSIFYITPMAVNYPNLGINIEQLVFAKYGVGNQGWPAAYILWTLMRSLLGLDDIEITSLLGYVSAFTSALFFIVLSIIVVGRSSHVYVTTLMFILPQTYYFKFFSDYSLAFPQLLLFLYGVFLIEKYSRREHLLSITLLSSFLILTNPITSFTIIYFLVFYVLIQLVLRSNNAKKLLILALTYTILFVGWYIYNHVAFHAVSPFVKAMSQLARLEEALSQGSYIRLARAISISPHFQLLYYYRYAMLGLLGFLSLCAIYILIGTRDKKRISFLLSFLFSCALPWFLLTASTLENFSSRFMLFGNVPASLMAGLTLLALRSKTRKTFGMFMIILSATLPISYALSFSPSLFNHASHGFDFEIARFIAERLDGNYLVVTDTWRMNYVRFYNPSLPLESYLDSITVFNVEPAHVYLPRGPHAILLSLPQRIQTLASFGRSLDDWEHLDSVLMKNYTLVYNNRYSLLWIVP